LVPKWTPSSAKHGISQADAAYVIQNHNFSIEINKIPGNKSAQNVVLLFIGPQHAGTDREIEVLVELPTKQGDQVVVFHVMPLGSKYRALRGRFINEERR
jgi:hypothetical protein